MSIQRPCVICLYKAGLGFERISKLAHTPRMTCYKWIRKAGALEKSRMKSKRRSAAEKLIMENYTKELRAVTRMDSIWIFHSAIRGFNYSKRICVGCGMEFLSYHGNKSTCSPSCAKMARSAKAKAESAANGKCYSITCAHCGIQFTANDPQTKTCSKACRARHKRARINVRYREKMKDPDYRKHINERAVIKKRKRKALKAGATIGNVKVMKNWELQWRDKSHVKCFWCLGEFRPDECHVDHIIAISAGGAHSIENLCIACSDCNLRKGSRSFTAWQQNLKQPVFL